MDPTKPDVTVMNASRLILIVKNPDDFCPGKEILIGGGTFWVKEVYSNYAVELMPAPCLEGIPLGSHEPSRKRLTRVEILTLILVGVFFAYWFL